MFVTGYSVVNKLVEAALARKHEHGSRVGEETQKTDITSDKS